MGRRRRINLHQINEDVSDKFLTLKSNLELLDNLEELDKHFNSKQPIINSQLREIKTVILNQIFQIQASGTSLIDLYQKVGSKLLKGNLLRATQDIKSYEEKDGQEAQFLPDPISSDKYLEDRTKGILQSDPVHLISQAEEIKDKPSLQQEAALNYLYAKQNLKPITRKTKDPFEIQQQLKLNDPAKYYAFEIMRDKINQHQVELRAEKRRQFMLQRSRPRSAEKRSKSVEKRSKSVEQQPEEEEKFSQGTQEESFALQKTERWKQKLDSVLQAQDKDQIFKSIIGVNKPLIFQNKYIELKSFTKNKQRQQKIIETFKDREELTGLKKRQFNDQEEYEQAVLEWYDDNFIKYNIAYPEGKKKQPK